MYIHVHRLAHVGWRCRHNYHSGLEIHFHLHVAPYMYMQTCTCMLHVKYTCDLFTKYHKHVQTHPCIYSVDVHVHTAVHVCAANVHVHVDACMCVLTSNPKTGSAASNFSKAYPVCTLVLPCFTCCQFGEDEVAILLNAAVAHLVIIRNTSAIFIPVDDFISIGTGHGH